MHYKDGKYYLNTLSALKKLANFQLSDNNLNMSLC